MQTPSAVVVTILNNIPKLDPIKKKKKKKHPINKIDPKGSKKHTQSIQKTKI